MCFQFFSHLVSSCNFILNIPGPIVSPFSAKYPISHVSIAIWMVFTRLQRQAQASSGKVCLEALLNAITTMISILPATDKKNQKGMEQSVATIPTITC